MVEIFQFVLKKGAQRALPGMRFSLSDEIKRES